MVVGVRFNLTLWQDAFHPPAQLIIFESSCMTVGVGLGNLLTQFVVSVSCFLIERVRNPDQPAQQIVGEAGCFPRLISLRYGASQGIVANCSKSAVGVNGPDAAVGGIVLIPRSV